MPTLLPYSVGPASTEMSAPPLAEGVAAFGFMIVALGVAHRRSVTVPLALGAFATAGFWMTGRATLGNPLLSTTVLFATKGLVAREVLSTVCASGAGAGLAVLFAWFLFPRVREAASVLLFAPPERSQE